MLHYKLWNYSLLVYVFDVIRNIFFIEIVFIHHKVYIKSHLAFEGVAGNPIIYGTTT